MIHVATVHWKSDRWIDVQRSYLDRFLGEHRLYGFLNTVPGDHAHKFFYASYENVREHAAKLNLLCDMVGLAADPADVLIAIDGDAFPVAPVAPLLGLLERHKLIAVQRYENHGDLQPHPCFCVTTAGFWRELGGDWHRGHEWLDLSGNPVTDVGGNMLGLLERAGVDWYPLRRVNRVDAHPLLFAVYGDERHGPVVYHHGGGFRAAAGRVARQQHGEYELRDTVRARAARAARRIPALRKVVRDPVVELRRRLKEEAAALGEEWFARVERDPEFWRELV